jgi:hypothetical protein
MGTGSKKRGLQSLVGFGQDAPHNAPKEILILGIEEVEAIGGNEIDVQEPAEEGIAITKDKILHSWPVVHEHGASQPRTTFVRD